ncbi:MAG: 2,3-bisphosphoglycerate-dependent phosphoglycerate mutase [Solirubrobacteraceae bacterium]|jgi:probable phosphoglycerate mutase|nr:2,3-bisphosphoglycerate-dependent phosphoglycerate mutase [Solirubrobacteraceae bacterium]
MTAMDAPTPPLEPRLYVVRHGQTESSARHAYSGHADVPLTPVGRDQARRAGERLAGAGVELIVSSPLSRARDTAAAIAAATGAPMQVDERLTEVDYGPFEGLDRDGARARFGPAFAAWREDPFGAPVPGMEPLGDALARARLATADVLAAARRPVVVGHQGILRLVLVALGWIAPADYFSTRLHEADPLVIAHAALAPPDHESS